VIIDTGLPQTFDLIVAAIADLGLKMEDFFSVLNTHGHPDHIGSNSRLRDSYSLPVTAPAGAAPWIEDHERQFREFPAAHPDAFLPDENFKQDWMALMDGECPVDLAFQGEITIRLDETAMLVSMPLPGHCTHETGYYEPSTKCLILGDAIALDHPAGFPAYEDPAVYRNSLTRLLNMVRAGDVEHMVVGHYNALDREGAEELLTNSLHRIEQINQATLESLKESRHGLSLREISLEVADKVGRTFNFQTPWTISGHLTHLQKAGTVSKDSTLWRLI
jgi:glyoxylase-like metal-dependent hydrolase (beta-lactamase superfamily II)